MSYTIYIIFFCKSQFARDRSSELVGYPVLTPIQLKGYQVIMRCYVKFGQRWRLVLSLPSGKKKLCDSVIKTFCSCPILIDFFSVFQIFFARLQITFQSVITGVQPEIFQGRGGFVKLEHSDKHFVKNSRKKRPHREKF